MRFNSKGYNSSSTRAYIAAYEKHGVHLEMAPLLRVFADALDYIEALEAREDLIVEMANRVLNKELP